MDQNLKSRIQAISSDILALFPCQSRYTGRDHPAKTVLRPIGGRVPQDVWIQWKKACPGQKSRHLERALRIYLEILKGAEK